MAKKNRVPKNDIAPARGSRNQTNQLFIWFCIFVAGFLAGVAFSVYKGKTIGTAPPAVVQQQEHDHTNEQAILDLEAEAAAHPENFENWIQLGHLYYDADQPEKAIAAYTKSLELHAGDANLLTDLGVMYRRTKQPEKAIELFDQAMKKDTTHLPSRFNKGIVLMYDLNNPAGAIAAWEELLAINPEAKTGSGEPISEFVEKVKADLAKNK